MPSLLKPDAAAPVSATSSPMTSAAGHRMVRSPKLQVPFVDLSAQYKCIKDEIDRAISAVIERSAFSGGPERDEFERHFATYVGRRYAVGVSSGTDALMLALRALGIGADDEVITVSHTFFATAEAITSCGASVRFVDVDPLTLNMAARQLEVAINPRTKAIVPVHLYGQIADMGAIMAIARKHDLAVIEDAAQAHGAQLEGRMAGSFGDLACFSFYPSKNLGAYGDAGAVVTDDPKLAASVRSLSNHGQPERYRHDLIGGCWRLDNLQAAVLDVKLRHLDNWNRARRRVASLYDELLTGIEGLALPHVTQNAEHAFHLYVIRVPDRERLRGRLTAAGIETGIHYPIPVHEQKAYAYLGIKPADLPVTHQVATEVLSLPMYPEITDAQVRYVASKARLAMGAERT